MSESLQKLANLNRQFSFLLGGKMISLAQALQTLYDNQRQAIQTLYDNQLIKKFQEAIKAFQTIQAVQLDNQAIKKIQEGIKQVVQTLQAVPTLYDNQVDKQVVQTIQDIRPAIQTSETQAIQKPQKQTQKVREIAKSLSNTQKKILLHIGKRCRGTTLGRCFEFKRNIAKACGVSRATVFNALKKLEDLLLIVRVKERPAGSLYRKSVIALRTELSEKVYDFLLREQRKERRATGQATTQPKPSQKVATELIASDSQVASKPSPIKSEVPTETEDNELIPPPPEVLAKINDILKPTNAIPKQRRTLSLYFDDSEIYSVLTPEEISLLDTVHRQSIIKRAEAKLRWARGQDSL